MDRYRLDIHTSDDDTPDLSTHRDLDIEDEDLNATDTMAVQWLTELCAEHDITPGPGQAYGVLYIYDTDGNADFYSEIHLDPDGA